MVLIEMKCPAADRIESKETEITSDEYAGKSKYRGTFKPIFSVHCFCYLTKL